MVRVTGTYSQRVDLNCTAMRRRCSHHVLIHGRPLKLVFSGSLIADSYLRPLLATTSFGYRLDRLEAEPAFRLIQQAKMFGGVERCPRVPKRCSPCTNTAIRSPTPEEMQTWRLESVPSIRRRLEGACKNAGMQIDPLCPHHNHHVGTRNQIKKFTTGVRQKPKFNTSVRQKSKVNAVVRQKSKVNASVRQKPKVS